MRRVSAGAGAETAAGATAGTAPGNAVRRRGRRILPGALGLLATTALALALAAPYAGARTNTTLARAKHQLLVRADFPSGWSSQGSVSTSTGGGSGSFPGARQLATCLGVSSKTFTVKASAATSPTFQSKDSTKFVQSTVVVFPSAKVARREYAALANQKMPACFTPVLQGPAGRQLLGPIIKHAKVAGISVAAAPRPWLVPHSSGFAVSFKVTTQGVTLNSSITVVTAARGQTGSELVFTSVGQPFPASLARHLNRTAYRRI